MSSPLLERSSLTILAGLTAILLVASSLWFQKVTSTVTGPYLDEVFHVRQAQQYCNGKFHVWDPKITTPPGLYLTSYLTYLVTHRCDTTALRAINCALLFFGVFALSFDFVRPRGKEGQRRSRKAITFSVHTAVNVCLFPPLFFFSSLYYTDVASTVAVLIFYDLHRRAQERQGTSRPSAIALISFGALALLFRQTNIFWVAVFPAGVALMHHFERLPTNVPKRPLTLSTTFEEVIQRSWSDMKVYDVPVVDTAFEDYIKTGASLALVAFGNPWATVTVLYPYVLLLAIFGAFVLWNGGVVLGDKSNHVATLHLSQMLYIWPYFTFFSFPLTYRNLLYLVPRNLRPGFAHRLAPKRFRSKPRLVLFALATVAAGVIIHYNTIIHPFTLADNRHYTFYVFRYFILRHPLQKYLYAALYPILAYATVLTLEPPFPSFAFLSSPSSSPSSAPEARTSFVIIWLITTSLSVLTAPLVEPRYFILPWLSWRLRVLSPPPQRASSSPSSAAPTPTSSKAASTNQPPQTSWDLFVDRVCDRDCDQAHDQAFDRAFDRAIDRTMDCPVDRPVDRTVDRTIDPTSDQAFDRFFDSVVDGAFDRTLNRAIDCALDRTINRMLLLETLWFLAINAATCYIFLYRGFAWPQEPGRVQRFMW